MAPYFPYAIIDQGWYMIIIFMLGLFFGIILEQSGFSSSRKLAGVFYGYDFVVLKVFFTAGITAMSGLVILGYFGIINLDVIFINSNFVVSAIIGGVIMGFGFILGGFCPGTSVTAAVIGKIDAMVFIVGIFLGIFLFGVFNSSFEKLFTGYYFNREMLSDTIGWSKHNLVFMMIIMAIVAFIVAEYFEKRSRSGPIPTNKRLAPYGNEIFMALVIATFILFLPEQRAKGFFERSESKMISTILTGDHYVDADKMAYTILNDNKNTLIVDVRGVSEFESFHLPYSINIPVNDITAKHHQNRLKEENRVVLVSNGGVTAAEALMLLLRQGYDNVYVLKDGINGFIETIFYDNTLPEGVTAFDEISKYRFRKNAAQRLLDKETLKVDIRLQTKERQVPVQMEISSGGGC